MSIELVTASCVLVGALNKAILQPQWLIAERIVPPGDAETEIMITLGPVNYRYTLGGLRWTVEQAKLTVQRVEAQTNPGEMIALVMDRLRHTPVQAVGSNFAFVPERALAQRLHEQSSSVLSKRLLEAHEDGGISHVMFQAPINDAQLQLTFDLSSGFVSRVSANYNRNVGTSSQAANAARRWKQDEDAARALFDRIAR